MTTTNSHDQIAAYDTVARAIRYVREHAREQPSLDDVAAHVGMSEFHLQRVFSAWAGISPKRFLQVVAVERASRALTKSDVLGAALDAGLSGPSRLHDLMVACEAMTPGERRAGGAGLDVACGVVDTPFGRAAIGATVRGVCHLHFVAGDVGVDGVERAIHARLPAARLVRDEARIGRVADDIFANVRAQRRPLHVLLAGTNFQVQVWKALVAIPAGATVSYSQIAKSIGRPSSTRAVASAVARNDVGLLIPCHRVIREDEDPSQGLMPKDPNANESIQSHVGVGSGEGDKSQYISTTKSLAIAKHWACKKKTKPLRIVRITLGAVCGSKTDLSCGDHPALTGATAKNFAVSSQEVLVEATIPAGAVSQVASGPFTSKECTANEKQFEKEKKETAKERKEARDAAKKAAAECGCAA